MELTYYPVVLVASLFVNGFVLFQFFTNPKWWNLLTNPMLFIGITIYFTTQIWVPGTSWYNPSEVIVAFMVTLISGSMGMLGWIELTFFIGGLIPTVMFAIGWLLSDMDEYPDQPFFVPMIAITKNGVVVKENTER